MTTVTLNLPGLSCCGQQAGPNVTGAALAMRSFRLARTCNTTCTMSTWAATAQAAVLLSKWTEAGHGQRRAVQPLFPAQEPGGHLPDQGVPGLRRRQEPRTLRRRYLHQFAVRMPGRKAARAAVSVAIMLCVGRLRSRGSEPRGGGRCAVQQGYGRDREAGLLRSFTVGVGAHVVRDLPQSRPRLRPAHLLVVQLGGADMKDA